MRIIDNGTSIDLTEDACVDRVIIDRPTSMTACANTAMDVARSTSIASSIAVLSIARQRETLSRSLHVESVNRNNKVL